VHKYLFQYGDLTITWYGVFVATGFLAGLWTASRRALIRNVSPEMVMDIGPWLLIGAIVGARTLYVISYWREAFANKPFSEIFMVQHGGLVYYGGLIGSTLACLLYVRIKKLSLWKLADILAPSIALGYFFGRFGCLMNGCCYGQPTTMPWGIQFPPDHESYPAHVHPTQIYDALLNLALYAGLAWLYRKKKFDGQVFAAYLICFAFTRSFVEMFRGDYPVHYLGGWATPAHLISMGILLAGALLFWKLPRRLELPRLETKG
jgi:phosphatidylglycerol---prolipoprotein diacylglyceryl transferase